MASLAEADTREGPEEVAAALARVEPLAGRFLIAKQALENLEPPGYESALQRADSATSPFNTSELVASNLSVAIDNLHVLFLYLRRARQLPMVAHYGLIRTAVEATSYGLWALAERPQVAASRTLRVAYGEQGNASHLFGSLGVSPWDPGEMQDLIRERYESLLRVKKKDLCSKIQTTNMISTVELAFEHRAGFTGLQVWRATSGLTHGSSAAMVALLERSPDGMRTSRMALSIAFLETAVENIEELVARRMALSQAPEWATIRSARTPSPAGGKKV